MSIFKITYTSFSFIEFNEAFQTTPKRLTAPNGPWKYIPNKRSANSIPFLNNTYQINTLYPPTSDD